MPLSLIWVTLFLVFASFEKCQIRFPLKNHEIAMGMCYDIAMTTPRSHDNMKKTGILLPAKLSHF